MAVLHCFSQIIPKRIVGSVWYFTTLLNLHPYLIYGPHSILLYMFIKVCTRAYEAEARKSRLHIQRKSQHPSSIGRGVEARQIPQNHLCL